MKMHETWYSCAGYRKCKYAMTESYIQDVQKKPEQIRSHSLIRETPQCTNFFIEIDCLGAYNVEYTTKFKICVFYNKLNTSRAQNFNA